ncbi:lipase member H [Denticeps clupeoides]|uniref:Lipase domain-containing protein n=1 Tax=Denticeps clupeoides TaxID=299321 RepID=A0AAY4DFX7_9TELE|nr:lipase member H-like [Denticeps clupeoides]
MLYSRLVGLLWISHQLVMGMDGECGVFTDLGLQHSLIGTSLNVQLLLYTRANSTCGRILKHEDPFSQPQLRPKRPTTFIIHGYRPTGSPPGWIDEFVELLLDRADLNVIVVDWNRGATSINYLTPVANTPKVARNVTDFIKKMQDHEASLSSIHLIGISLGAHISGFIGAAFEGRVGRITALDPAGPQFTDTSTDKRLDPSDAQFVDVVHTDMDALGFRKPLGHIDYYANGGSDQPGCPKTIAGGSGYFKCDHQRSVYLFLDSIKNTTCNMTSYPCRSYQDFLDAKCLDCDQFKDGGCPVFGYDVLHWKERLLQLNQTSVYFTTNSLHPFCKTLYKVEIVTWNQETKKAYITLKLYGKEQETEATIDHTASEFQQYTKTTLLAQFDQGLQKVEKVLLRFRTGNLLCPRYKLRLLRIQLTPIQSNLRPMCRYDLLLEHNKDVFFRPIPCRVFSF